MRSVSELNKRAMAGIAVFYPLSSQEFLKCCPKKRLVQIKMAGLSCFAPSLFCKRFQFVVRGKSFD